MKYDRIEKIGLWIVGVSFTVFLFLISLGLVTMVTGCVSAGQVRGDTPWCFRAESRGGEPLSFCSAEKQTCREAQQLASHYASKHLSAVTRCERK